MPFNPSRPNELAVRINEEWKPIQYVHRVSYLFDFLMILFKENGTELAKRTITDWSGIPAELKNWINEISKFDDNSTFFRYPDFEYDIKSDIKKINPDEIPEAAKSNSGKMKIFLKSNGVDQSPNIFLLDSANLSMVLDILIKTSEELNTPHFALRCELCEGS